MASKVNLNPGADTSLVAAATNAAMANVPQDYSRAFNEIAKGYGKYAEGLGNVFKGLATANSEAIGKLTAGIKKYVGDSIEIATQKKMVIIDEYEDKDFTPIELAVLNFQEDDARDKRTPTTDMKSYKAFLGSLGYDTSISDADLEKITADDVIKEMNKKKADINKKATSGTKIEYINSDNVRGEVVVADDTAFFLTLKDDVKKANEIDDEIIKKAELLKIDNIKQNAKNSDRKFARVLINGLQAIENEELLIQPLNGGVTVDFLRAADARGERIDDGSHIKEGFDKNGNKVIIWVDKFGKVKVNPITGKQFIATAGDISDFLVKKDATVKAGIDKAITIDQIEASSIKGAKFEEYKTKDAIMSQVSNKHKFLNAINERHGNMELEYVEAVYGDSFLTEEMYVELNKLGGRFDNVGNDGVNAEDFATEENFAVLAKFLTTDSATSREIFTNFVLGEAEIKFNEGVERREKAVGFQEGNSIKVAERIQAANVAGYNKVNIQRNLPKDYAVDKVNKDGELDINGNFLVIRKGRNVEFTVDPNNKKQVDYLTAWLYSQNGIK